MRRSVLSAIFAAGLSLVACSEQPTEAGPGAIAPPLAVTTSTCSEPVTPSDITGRIDQLFPSGPLRTSAQSRFKSIPDKITKTTGTSARDKAFLLIDFILQNYYAGNLIDGTSLDKVLQLITALQCYVGLAPLSLPSTTAGSDIVVGVAFPNVETRLCTPSGDGALLVPSTAVTTTIGPVAIAIYDLADEPPPLRTSLDQYPRFYHFSGAAAAGQVEFATPVSAAVGLRGGAFEGDLDDLRLAHNVGPNFGDVEVLPTAAAPSCGPVGSIRGGGTGSFAWAKKLFLPNDLHAAAAAAVEEIVKVGGTTRKFSEFGIVDITSNPGSFAPIGPTESTEEGGPVTRTVLVTSDNGTPIKDVPVTFTTEEGNGSVLTPQPVLTDEEGNASASWALPEGSGDFTLNVSVPGKDNDPLETSDPPTGDVASTPDVAFDPQSLTFTATVISTGFIAGRVLHAFTGAAINGAEVTIPEGSGVRRTFTTSDGRFTMSGVVAGTHNVTVNATGFTSATRLGVIVTAGATTQLGDISLAPVAAATDIRVVLDWGERPSDLDSHFSGPRADGGRFHVYYAAPTFSDAASAASLDRDDTNGFGPETVTLTRQSDGEYQYYVHNFSGEQAITASGATARVFRGTELLATFTVPTTGDGRYWHVFNLNGTTITSVNLIRTTEPTVSANLFALQSTNPEIDDLPMIARDVSNTPKPDSPQQ